MKKQKGFTLVELLVVVAIIGILAAIALVYLPLARAKARDAKRVSAVSDLKNVLELYYNDQLLPAYPRKDTPDLLTSADLPTQYIGTIPVAPTPADDPCDGATNSYQYKSYVSQSDTSNGTGWYRIRFCLGRATGGLSEGCAVADPGSTTNGNCVLP